jgi:hypothetical protein
MARLWNKEWTKEELLKRVGDMDQIAYARSAVLDGGKAEGVNAVFMNNGSCAFTVLPGRCLDVADISCHGLPFAFISGAGITSPSYNEEPGDGWVRSFYGGLLETCGITYSGAAGVDEGVALGVHGRIGNAAAEDVGIRKEWRGDDYYLSVEGIMRESSPFRDINVRLKRKISTCLGSQRISISDVISNVGYTPQPLMMLYHFNFGFPAVSADSEVVGPFENTEGRDDASKINDGVANCLSMENPVSDYPSQVFFHRLKSDDEGNTFVALVNKNRVDGKPFAVVLQFNKNQLPEFTECKIMKNGFYFLALEPGTSVPLGRKALKEMGKVIYLDGQEDYKVEIDIEILDTEEEITWLYNSRDKLLNT